MAWWTWLILAACVLLLIAAASLAALRLTQRGRRFLGLSTRGKLRCMRALLRDPGTPWYAKLIVAGVVGYLLLPFDLIPDVIPVLGQLDDLAVVVTGVALLLWLVPAERFEAALNAAEALEKARAEEPLRRAG